MSEQGRYFLCIFITKAIIPVIIITKDIRSLHVTYVCLLGVLYYQRLFTKGVQGFDYNLMKAIGVFDDRLIAGCTVLVALIFVFILESVICLLLWRNKWVKLVAISCCILYNTLNKGAGR